jgi:lysophospholipase L1-like esterase
MKTKILSVLGCLASLAFAADLRAQTNAPVATNAPAVAEVRTNTAIVPSLHTGQRTETVMQRARENPGVYDIAFIGDSITQGWEGAGKNVWQKYYGKRKCINFGVGGDRTQHVLWRFEHGQLVGIKAKAVVLMIGTNNSNKDDNTEADILEGVQAIVKQIRERLPDTKIILCSIFPRGKTFSTQRGKILQVNQALEKLDDGKSILYADFGSKMIETDGSISTGMMRDALHPGERGYEIWAAAIEPKLRQVLKHHWFKR